MRLSLAAAGVVALLAAGCGASPGDGNTAVPGRDPASTGSGGLSLSLAFDEPLAAGSEPRWELTVTNDGPPVTLRFPDGRRGDVVLRRDEQEAYRWSAGRVFTQTVAEEDLGTGEAGEYPLEGTLLDVEPGEHELTATLASDPAPPPVVLTVRVEG